MCNKNKPHLRFVNIKYINESFVFFTNYQSPKSNDLMLNDSASLTFFWNTSNAQIRIEGKVKMLSKEESDYHWSIRSKEKKSISNFI